ncbi:hypothetical protein BDP27DRAFT_1430937 [Rhodocollybia butyracea]|uniref:Uncharacterized protein n=1 Tax=Rhodocollybia butyracea TaxID=206335 RepID=A0A9P5PCK9_9AGAR|nr:hypothetical protein BDP27DRAFT_1430937 [Rhodocollybia butyracea]
MPPQLAVITHPKSDRCPILEAGTITPLILQQWHQAYERYLKNNATHTKDDIISFIADEMWEPILIQWYTASQTRIDKLTLKEYLSELAGLVLKKGWEGKMRREVMGAKLGIDVSFAEWAYEMQNLNAILSQAAPAFAVDDPHLKNILDAGLSPKLQESLDAEPVLATELNAWIAEVKSRDDRVAIETNRIRTAVTAVHTCDAQKSKKSLGDRLTPHKTALVNCLSTGTTAPKTEAIKCPTLTSGEKELLDIHNGCRRCRTFYIRHCTANCNGNFPDGATYQTLTQADAQAHAKVAGVPLRVKRERVGAVQTHKATIIADYEESDTDEFASPFTVSHLYADVSLTGPAISEFPISSTSLLDIGCPSTVISAELSDKLGLRRFPLPKEEDNLSSLSEEPLWCTEYVKLRVSSKDGSWMSGTVRAKINNGLCIPLILGMPFLTSEHIVIDAQARTAVDKRVGYDLMNPVVHPPRPPPPVWVTPLPTPKKICLPKQKFVPTNRADLPVSVMLEVKQRIETLALQDLLQRENELAKRKHADMFPV